MKHIKDDSGNALENYIGCDYNGHSFDGAGAVNQGTESVNCDPGVFIPDLLASITA